jgi:flagellar protein FlgJ
MQVYFTDRAAGNGALESVQQPRLVQAAHEFEGQMLKELLKPMTSSDGLTGGDDGADSSSGQALGEFASEALGKALSEQGGFGIANQIVRQLSSFGNKPAKTGVTKESAHQYRDERTQMTKVI